MSAPSTVTLPGMLAPGRCFKYAGADTPLTLRETSGEKQLSVRGVVLLESPAGHAFFTHEGRTVQSALLMVPRAGALGDYVVASGEWAPYRVRVPGAGAAADGVGRVFDIQRDGAVTVTDASRVSVSAFERWEGMINYQHIKSPESGAPAEYNWGFDAEGNTTPVRLCRMDLLTEWRLATGDVTASTPYARDEWTPAEIRAQRARPTDVRALGVLGAACDMALAGVGMSTDAGRTFALVAYEGAHLHSLDYLLYRWTQHHLVRMQRMTVDAEQARRGGLVRLVPDPARERRASYMDDAAGVLVRRGYTFKPLAEWLDALFAAERALFARHGAHARIDAALAAHDEGDASFDVSVDSPAVVVAKDARQSEPGKRAEDTDSDSDYAPSGASDTDEESAELGSPDRVARAALGSDDNPYEALAEHMLREAKRRRVLGDGGSGEEEDDEGASVGMSGPRAKRRLELTEENVDVESTANGRGAPDETGRPGADKEPGAKAPRAGDVPVGPAFSDLPAEVVSIIAMRLHDDHARRSFAQASRDLWELVNVQYRTFYAHIIGVPPPNVLPPGAPVSDFMPGSFESFVIIRSANPVDGVEYRYVNFRMLLFLMLPLTKGLLAGKQTRVYGAPTFAARFRAAYADFQPGGAGPPLLLVRVLKFPTSIDGIMPLNLTLDHVRAYKLHAWHVAPRPWEQYDDLRPDAMRWLDSPECTVRELHVYWTRENYAEPVRWWRDILHTMGVPRMTRQVVVAGVHFGGMASETLDALFDVILRRTAFVQILKFSQCAINADLYLYFYSALFARLAAFVPSLEVLSSSKFLLGLGSGRDQYARQFAADNAAHIATIIRRRNGRFRLEIIASHVSALLDTPEIIAVMREFSAPKNMPTITRVFTDPSTGALEHEVLRPTRPQLTSEFRDR